MRTVTGASHGRLRRSWKMPMPYVPLNSPSVDMASGTFIQTPVRLAESSMVTCAEADRKLADLRPVLGRGGSRGRHRGRRCLLAGHAAGRGDDRVYLLRRIKRQRRGAVRARVVGIRELLVDVDLARGEPVVVQIERVLHVSTTPLFERNAPP